MKKQRITLYIAEDLWRDFRAECVRRGYSASQIVDILVHEQMSAWNMGRAGFDVPTDSEIGNVATNVATKKSK